VSEQKVPGYRKTERERKSNTVTVMVLGGGKRVSHLTSCAAKAVSFVSLAAIIFSLRLPDEPSGEYKSSGERKERGKCIGQLNLETRKFLPFGSLEIPAGDGNKGIQTAECIGKSNLELREFPPFGSKGIPTRNKNKGTQMAECVGKSNLELRKFLPVRSKEIPARNRNKGTQMAECVRKSSLELGKSPPVGDEEISAKNGTRTTRFPRGGGKGVDGHPNPVTALGQHWGGAGRYPIPGNSLQDPRQDPPVVGRGGVTPLPGGSLGAVLM
jgi:hypothetical protein